MADYAYEIIKRVREIIKPGALIISGGVHPSIFPEESMNLSDIVVKFEGEDTIVELIAALIDGKNLNTVRGIYFSENDKIIYTGDREFIKELDSLPFPAWDLMPMENYNTQMHLTGGRRMPVMGSRGCPYACSYCVSPFHWKRTIRWRSAKNVVDEIEKIYNELKIDKIHFWDDNLFLNKEYLTELCNEILRRKLKIIWLGLTRASHIVKCADLMPLIKESGCIGMEMGIESADAQSHKAINKEENIEVTKAAAELLKKNGMVPMFTYMALNPGDTLTTYYKQAEVIDEILSGCGWINFFHPLPVPLYIGQLCTPHPGTKLFDEAKNLGIPNTKKWTDFYHHRVNFIPNSLLDDIPVKIVDTLTYRELLICVKGILGSVFNYIECNDSLLKRLYKIALILKIVKNFFNLCDGTRSVRQITAILQKSFNYENIIFWNNVCISIVALAQLGYIQSVSNQKKLPLRNIDISGFGDTMRLARRLHIIDLLKNIIITSYKNPFINQLLNSSFDIIFNFIKLKKIEPVKNRIKSFIKNKLGINKKTFNPSSIKYYFKYNFFKIIRKDKLNKAENIIDSIISGLNSNFLAYRGPEFVQIDLTNACNLNCVCCWFYSPLLSEARKPNNIWKKSNLNFFIIKKLIDELSYLNSKTIHLGGGGDPCAHPELVEIVKYIKSKKLDVSINTNLTLLNEEKLNQLLTNGVNWFTLSIWGGSQEAYIAVHPNQKKDTFDRIKNNLKTIREFKKNNLSGKPDVMIINVISNKNYLDLLNMYKIAVEYGVNFIWYQVFDPIDATQELCLSDREKGDVFLQCEEIKKLHENNKNNNGYILELWQFERFISRLRSEDRNKRGFYDENRVLKIPCYAGWTYSRIAANGDVVPCCKGYGFPTGNIYKQKFSEIWNGWKYREFRNFAYNHLLKHPLFSPIAEQGCLKTCDNYNSNLDFFNLMNKKLGAITKPNESTE